MAIRVTHARDAATGTGLTSEQVWQAVAAAALAILSYLTPAGEPQSSGVVYKVTATGWSSRSLPVGTPEFRTFALGVSVRAMRNPARPGPRSRSGRPAP
jgi:hypothetical protein